jgi:hypothetical protein
MKNLFKYVGIVFYKKMKSSKLMSYLGSRAEAAPVLW